MPSARSDDTFREGSTPILHQQLYKRGKNRRVSKLPLGELSTITLTYFNQADGAVINSRNGQNVKNANNVIVTPTCEVIWEMDPSDTVCSDTSLDDGRLEHHIALFEWVLTNGLKGSSRRSIYIVRDSKV